ncbi:MAG: glucosaminidase domain-containing protein [Flavobacteriales bacterium]|nr:glucosaminidase domain-containing protein [Flavobacteriales bacterium]
MMRYSLIILFFLPLFASATEDRITRSQYIDQWSEEAIYQMVVHKIPASITLAQGILESGDGNSELARKANNHFGIKCHSDWKGKKVYHDDDKKGECFRHYKNAKESFEDHSDFLLRKRYASLFELKISDYKGWAKGLKKCGYATSSKYATLLIRIIEENDLTRYDKMGMKMIKNGEVPQRQDAEDDEEPIAVAKKKEEKRNKKQRNKTSNDKLDDVSISKGRSVSVSKNNIKFVIAKEGDTFESLAKELDLMPWQLWKYNDLDKNTVLSEGQMLYLQPKRNSNKVGWYTVEEGDTMESISQQYGVKLKALYKKNGMAPGTQPTVGQKLSLKKKIG